MSDSEIEIEEYKKLIKPPTPKKKTPTKPKNENKWIKHVLEYRKQNPEVKYTDCLKQAKLTYKKT